ncbi:hypothetical protein MHH85_21030 [Viridibacillus sp. FSL E2-0187]|uniref:hypothetical protein n=1 Tax=Viridibacillus sp. FSL E2-0187 TaxID=2921362 RepID=UPI0030FAB0D0
MSALKRGAALIGCIWLLGACSIAEKAIDKPIEQQVTFTGKNMMKYPKLTAREETILDRTTEQYLIYEYQIDKSYNHLRLWVEAYEKGKLADSEVLLLNSEVKGSGTIIMNTIKKTESNAENILSLSVTSGNGSNSSSIRTQLPKMPSEPTFTVWKSTIAAEKNIESEMILGYMIHGYSNETEPHNYEEISENPQKLIKELSANKEVYILKSKFIKK